MKDLYVQLTVASQSPGRPSRHVMATPDAGLHIIEACVLAVVHADPRLATKRHRDRLRLVMADLDESFTPHRVGEALARVRMLAQAAAVDTDAFSPDVVWAEPGLEACEAAYETVSKLFGRGGGKNVQRLQQRRTRFLRLMGHEVSMGGGD